MNENAKRNTNLEEYQLESQFRYMGKMHRDIVNGQVSKCLKIKKESRNGAHEK